MEIKKQAPALLGLLDSYLKSRSRRPEQCNTARLEASRRLKKFLNGQTAENRIVHYCPYGCHGSLDEAREQVEADICTVWLNSPPTPPAYNKWQNIYGPRVVRNLHSPAQLAAELVLAAPRLAPGRGIGPDR